jgi:predicted metal-dependent peptidase
MPASESEMAEESASWNMALNNAERAAKAAGTLKGFMSRLVDQLTAPIIPWREVIARFIQTELTRNDYSWQRINVRHIQRGFILPSLYSMSYGKVAVAVDTSGSATSKEIKEMLSEVIGILELYEDTVSELTLPVIYADYAVCGVDYLGIGDEPHPKGGGGTDYVPVFEWLDDADDEYAALIYMTDGYCSSFPRPDEVRVPVIWALTQRNDTFKPPFGETITIRQ